MLTRKVITACFVLAIIGLTTLVFRKTQSFRIEIAQGQRLFDRQEYDEALPHLRSAFNMRPTDNDLAARLLLACYRTDRHEEARDILQGIAARHPDDVQILSQLGDMLHRFQDLPGAERIYKMALAIRHDLPTRFKLAEVLMWQKKYDEAIPLLEELTSSAPENTRHLEMLADAYSWSKRYAKAIETYKRLAPVTDRRKEILLKLADSLRHAGRNAEAEEIYKEMTKSQ